MRILAIDQNTKTGLALGEPGRVPTLWTVNFRRDETDEFEDIFGRALSWFAAFFRDNAVDFVAIERVVPPSSARGHTNHATTMLTIGLYGIVTGVVRAKAIPNKRVAVQTWRASFLGKGGGRLPSAQAKRETMTLCRRLGWEPDGQDSADAAGLWAWACVHVCPHGVTTLKPALFAEADADRDEAWLMKAAEVA